MDMEASDEYGRTPLRWAAYMGHLPVVQYLCEEGADKEARNRNGMTQLHCAAQQGHLPVVQYLCEQAAGKDVEDRGGTTPLRWAAAHGHLHVLQYFEGLKWWDDGMSTTAHCTSQHARDTPVIQCLI